MSQVYSRSGIRFEYPANWKLETENSDDGWTASVYSPATAFLMVSYHPDEDDPAHLADGALKIMKESYPDLESESVVETLAGMPSIGHTVGFFALDLTNTCWIRSFAVDSACVLLLCQCTDEELPGNGAILSAIRSSVSVEDAE
jgi:hypothetical protein